MTQHYSSISLIHGSDRIDSWKSSKRLVVIGKSSREWQIAVS